MNEKSKLLRFLYPVLQNPSLGIKNVLLYALFTLSNIINIYFVKLIIQSLENGDINSFQKYFLYTLMFYVVYYILAVFWRHRGRASSVYVYYQSIHDKYIPKFITLDNNSIEKIGTGKMVAIISKAIFTWSNMLTDTINVFTKLSITLIFTIFMIYPIGAIYILYFLLLFIGLHIFSGILNKFALIYRSQKIDIENDYTRHIVKIIMSKFEILQNNKIDQEVKRLDNYTSQASAKNIKLNNYLFGMYSTPDIMTTILRISAFAIIGYGVFQGLYKISDFVVIIALIGYMEAIFIESVDFYKRLTKSFGEIEKLWLTFDEIPPIKGYYEGNNFVMKKGDIKIQNITFGYGDKNVFEEFSLDIKGNKKTAFVGISGSGKTTLVKLITGYIRPDNGNILVDGQKLSEIKLKSYYPHIGYLTQEPSVFDGSIIENLTYGVESDLSPARIEEVIKLSNCEFIYQFKDGLDTQIGERGVRLSGGQKQRLAIAKVMLKNPMIIILDEPTSALDSFSEDQITKALNNLFDGRTVIIIAHRLQTVKNADEIILIESGKLIERGTHENLVSQNGYYKKMLDLQSGFFE